MSKVWKALRVLATVGRILSTVVFVCCIVGASLCLLGIIGLSSGVGILHITVGDIDIIGLVEEHAGMTVSTMIAAMSVGIILCAGEAVVAKFGEVYFRHELEADNPFTYASAKETIRLGILTAAIPFVTGNMAFVFVLVMKMFFNNIGDVSVDTSFPVTLGVMLVVLGLFFWHAAERLEGKYPVGADTPAPAGQPVAKEAPTSAEAPALAETPASEEKNQATDAEGKTTDA